MKKNLQYEPFQDLYAPFRLIELLPVSHGKTIHCKLFNANIPAFAGKYIALSYVCGSPEPSRTITVNGCLLLIGPNLHDFLLRCRKAFTPLLLWTDAICMDQDPNAHEERSQQVNSMGTIYENASSVYSWLGKEAAAIAGDLRMLRMLYGKSDDGKMEMYRSRNERREKYEDHAFRTLKALSGCGPFDRVWIVQEMILAQKLYFVLEHEKIEWRIVADWLSYFSHVTDPWSTRHEITNSSLARLWKAKMKVSSAKGHDLESTFMNFSHLSCTLAHDRVYALMGLCNAGLLEQHLKVNYSRSIYSLIHDVFSNFEFEHPLTLLQHAMAVFDVDPDQLPGPYDNQGLAEVAMWLSNCSEREIGVCDVSALDGSSFAFHIHKSKPTVSGRQSVFGEHVDQSHAYRKLYFALDPTIQLQPHHRLIQLEASGKGVSLLVSDTDHLLGVTLPLEPTTELLAHFTSVQKPGTELSRRGSTSQAMRRGVTLEDWVWTFLRECEVQGRNSKDPVRPHLKTDLAMLCGLAAFGLVCTESGRAQSEPRNEYYWQRTKGAWLRFFKRRSGR